MSLSGRVEGRRDGRRQEEVAVAGGIRHHIGASFSTVAKFPLPAHRFQASGSRTRSYTRPRKADRSQSKAGESPLLPESLAREAHRLPGTHLVFAAQPLAQPPITDAMDHGLDQFGMEDLAEVVRQVGVHHLPVAPVRLPMHVLDGIARANDKCLTK